jgi:NCAIR mutase (PurE)-related protein
MNEDKLKEIFEGLKAGRIEINDAIGLFRDFEYKELEYAKVDNHRSLRTGYPEVVFGQNKTKEQIAGIVEYMLTRDNNILVTRASKEAFDLISVIAPDALYHEIAKTITIRKKTVEGPKSHIAIVSAGTSDMFVSEEAAITAEIFDNEVRRYYDVGVAGIHRF